MDKYNKGQCNDNTGKCSDMGQGQWKDKDQCEVVQGKEQRKNPVQGKEPARNPGQFNDPKKSGQGSKSGKPGFKK